MSERDEVWKNTDDAPKDGSMFLVCFPRMMNLVVRCTYDRVHGYFKTDMNSDGGIVTPTFFHKNERYGDDVWTEIPELPRRKTKARKPTT